MVISALISMIRSSLKSGSANDVPLLPRIDTISNFSCLVTIRAAPWHPKWWHRRRGVRNKGKRGSGKRNIRDCFHGAEWEFRVRLSEVERYRCQVIIISFKALTSHLTELTLFNLSLKWKSLHSAVEVILLALSLRQAACVIVISTKGARRSHLNKVVKRSRGY